MLTHLSIPRPIKLACLAAMLLLITAGCSSLAATPTITPTAPPTATTTPLPSPTATITPLPSPTATPTPLIEPVLPPAQSSDPLAVDPPENFDNALKAQVNDGAFDLVDAQATYAYYRAEVGPAMWASDAEFIQAMDTYAASLEAQGIEVYQATAASGTTYSMLVEGTSILLNFDQSGALTFADPGYWTAESEPVWIDAGGPVDLVIGPDNHAYIVRLDSEGNVVAYLNTWGATLDNIDDQWISVTVGRPDMVWNGSEFISAGIPILEIAGPCATNPEVISLGRIVSCEYLLSLPSPITPEEFARWQQGQEPGLGAIARNDHLDGSLAGVMAVGRIVEVSSHPLNLDGSDSYTRLVVDVPHQSGLLRFIFALLPGNPSKSIYNLDQFRDNVFSLTSQGLNPLAEDYYSEANQDAQTDLRLNASQWREILANPEFDWIGQPIGFHINTQSLYYDADLTVDPNYRPVEIDDSIVPAVLVDPTLPVTSELRMNQHIITDFWITTDQIDRLTQP